ncbi:unnamed protein product, partial [Mesorhabditis belari]|uniref:Mannosyltransferase n=1 Tax=Mesorhabditis belari TaxID=2138241 RepID=A0AAF3EMG7_9BILA
MGRLHRNDDSFASSSRDKEESFNRQATHDLIYENYNISNRDHNDFPGVVPRTFVGPFALASFGFPLRIVFWLFGIQKIWMLFAVCLFLGAAVVISFCNFFRCIRKHFGEETAIFLRVITASHRQFHLLFYTVITSFTKCRLCPIWSSFHPTGVVRRPTPNGRLLGDSGNIFIQMRTGVAFRSNISIFHSHTTAATLWAKWSALCGSHNCIKSFGLVIC